MIIRMPRVDRSRGSWGAAALAALLGTGGLAAQQSETPRAKGPGLVERTRVTLLLLEVEAVDRKGQPMPGLAQSDFVVRLDGRRWPVASFDNFCGAGETGPESPPPSDARMPDTRQASPARADRFVLFMDFGEMTLAGRSNAIDAARQWVADSMRPGDEAMLAGYSTRSGTVVLQEFTGRREALTAALDRARRDLSNIDEFPDGLETRVEICRNDPSACIQFAREEYWQGHRSLKALEAFLGRLESVPGRKHLILFHQNGMLFPGEIYGGVPGDHVSLTNEVDAQATAAQTAIHTARVGALDRVPEFDGAARSLGGRLAEGTGGRYNLGPSDLGTTVAAAGSRGRCLYVLGLEPPSQPSRRIYTASVTARGVTLPALLQIRFRTELDQWLRKASAVLASPGQARDVPLTAAILPRHAGSGRWSVSIQVAVDEDALVQVPSAGRSRGEWEVGAVLQPTERRGKWEMFGSFTLAQPAEVRSNPVLVHERQIEGLRPGPYRLTAFVRDRIANLFGGAQALLSLPDPRGGGGSGPVLVRPGRLRIVSALPLTGTPPAADAAGRRDVGAVPAASITLSAGETLDILTWICPGERAASPALRRFLVKDEVPIFRLPDASLQPAGDCFLLDDPIGPHALGPGHYTYELQWGLPGASLRLEHPIEVIDARATRAVQP